MSLQQRPSPPDLPAPTYARAGAYGAWCRVMEVIIVRDVCDDTAVAVDPGVTIAAFKDAVVAQLCLDRPVEDWEFTDEEGEVLDDAADVLDVTVGRVHVAVRGAIVARETLGSIVGPSRVTLEGFNECVLAGGVGAATITATERLRRAALFLRADVFAPEDARRALVSVLRHSYAEGGDGNALVPTHDDLLQVFLDNGTGLHAHTDASDEDRHVEGPLDALLVALLVCSVKTCSRIARCVPDINAARVVNHWDRMVPLAYAVRQGAPEKVKALVESGAATTGDAGRAAMLEGVRGTSCPTTTAMVAMLLDLDVAPPHDSDARATALHAAAGNGARAIVALLLDRGGVAVDVVAKNNPARPTPLFAAAGAGQTEVMELLLERGADAMHEANETPLVLLAKLHLPRGTSDRRAVRSTAITGTARRLIEAGVDVNAPCGSSALYYAARCDHVALVDLLLAHGADCGHTPGTIAAGLGTPDILRTYHSHGVDLAAARFENSRTLLHAAIHAIDSDDLVRICLDEYLCAPDAADDRGWRPLHDAAWTGNVNICRCLLSAGSDIHAPDARGRTPLHIAAASAYPDVVACLLDAGAHVDGSDASGRSPLFHAACAWSEEVCRVLLARGADILSRDAWGRTPLMAALEMYCVKAARVKAAEAAYMLLAQAERAASWGAGGPIPRGNDGQSSLDVAAKYATPRMCRVVFDNDADGVGAEEEMRQRARRVGGRTTAEQAEDAVEDERRRAAAKKATATVYGVRSAMATAARAGRVDVMRALVMLGGSVADAGDGGVTPLMHAVASRLSSAVEHLLDAGAPADARDDCGRTAAHYIAEDHVHDMHRPALVRILRALRKRGADLNAVDGENLTPLGRAAMWGDMKLCDVVLAGGADGGVCGGDGRTYEEVLKASRGSYASLPAYRELPAHEWERYTDY